MDKVRDYFICVYANKITFSGFCLVIFVLVVKVTFHYTFSNLPNLLVFLFWYGVPMLIFSKFGLRTFKVYRRVLKLKNYNYSKIERKLATIYDDFYCKKVGYKAALKTLNKKTLNL